MRTIELNNGTIGYVKDNVFSIIEYVRENFSDEVGRILHNEFENIMEKKDLAEKEYDSLTIKDEEKIGNLEDEIHRLNKENMKLEEKVNSYVKAKIF